MKQVIIENPVINSPFQEPQKHFCFSTEAAKKYGDIWIENGLRQANEDANPELFRFGDFRSVECKARDKRFFNSVKGEYS